MCYKRTTAPLLCRESVFLLLHSAHHLKMKHVALLCLVTVLRSCLVCAGLDSVLVGKLSELSHLSSRANRVTEALLSHLNDTNPLRAVATALVQGLTCISQQTLKGTEVCCVLPEP